MCIRDRALADEPRLLGLGEVMDFPAVIAGEDSIWPVSYTHLDVYKRQGARHELVHETNKEEVFRDIAQWLDTVSYTHLDVYKRQELLGKTFASVYFMFLT